METGGRPDCGVCAAVDVRYLRTGGARAAAVLAADAGFAHVLAERTVVVPRVAPCRPGEFYLRELPPLRAVLEDLTGLGLLVVDGYADLDPGGRPGLGAHAYAEFGIPVTGGGQIPVPPRDPRGAGPARILGTPAVRHRRRDAPR
jgi:deoxyribonuclease V